MIRSFIFSAEAKFERAVHHADALNAALSDYSKDQKYSFALDTNSDATEYVLKISLVRQPPATLWSTILADSIQNFRACLDHALYGLAVAYNKGVNPPPHDDALQFPIADKPGAFNYAVDNRKRLGALVADPDARKLIEDLQPYSRPNLPWRPILSILRDLNDREKHRLIPIISASLQSFEAIPVYEARPGLVGNYRIRMVGPIEGPTEVYRMTFNQPVYDLKLEQIQVAAFPGIRNRRADGVTCYHPIDWLVGQFRLETRHILDEITAFAQCCRHGGASSLAPRLRGMHELRDWLRDHGFAVVAEEVLDFGVLLVLQPPAGKTMRVVYRPGTPDSQVIDMVRQVYRSRGELLN